jgi:hypothetical protein
MIIRMVIFYLDLILPGFGIFNEQVMDKDNKSRRIFLKAGMGASVVLAGGVMLAAMDNRKARFIGKDGKIYEVNVKKLRKAARPVLKSHQDINDWIQKSDHG